MRIGLAGLEDLVLAYFWRVFRILRLYRILRIFPRALLTLRLLAHILEKNPLIKAGIDSVNYGGD